eukprot:TRINITY_DN0_c1154_g1_i2.p2 TRINITY_DN0_c1154_g1~~TRINITY_DN0_c1154_g1_i2.p2  ORF type:complete len:139 (-),score=18.71 TRINITY_DN0_c1154_g1_i2:32-448(-)
MKLLAILLLFATLVFCKRVPTIRKNRLVLLQKQGTTQIYREVATGIVRRNYPTSKQRQPFMQEDGSFQETVTINFDKPFSTIPLVTLSIPDIELTSIESTGFKTDALNLTPQSFDLRIATPKGSELKHITVSWIAFGE